MKQIESGTGRFYIDTTGRLVRYENTFLHDRLFWNDSSWSDASCPPDRRISDLYIPEGVRELPDNAFHGYEIREIKLPSSLKRLGSHALSCSCIGEIAVPEGADPGMMRQLAHALRFVFTWDSKKLLKGWPEEYVDIYLGKSEPRESWQRLDNSSGTFLVDSDGVLMDFWPAQRNTCSFGSEKELVRLHIPEGVKAIPSEMFDSYTILWEISFPRSLKCIGIGCGYDGGTFANCRLPDVVLPENLEVFGRFAFGGCYIRSLTIPGSLRESLLYMGVRQFKDCHIGEIRVPVEFRDILEEACKGKRGVSIDEITDPQMGRLCCAKAQGDDLLGWGNFVLYMLSHMFG